MSLWGATPATSAPAAGGFGGFPTTTAPAAAPFGAPAPAALALPGGCETIISTLPCVYLTHTYINFEKRELLHEKYGSLSARSLLLALGRDGIDRVGSLC